MPILFAFREDRFGFRFEIKEQAVFGRSPECDLILFDRAASRRHAEITYSENGYVLRDLGTTNGTFCNDVMIKEPTPLKKNDEIRVGQEIFLFDPDLDVAVGSDGIVLIVGDMDRKKAKPVVMPGEVELGALEKTCLGPLVQMALALSNRPKRERVLKQTAYALVKLFSPSQITLLWPETEESQILSVLLTRPEGRRVVLPRPMTDMVVRENKAVLWPHAFTDVSFIRGKRTIKEAERTTMAVPIKAHGELSGLIYVESGNRAFTGKDLQFLTALAGLIGPALCNSSLIDYLNFRLAEEKKELSEKGTFVGEDPQITALLATISQVAVTDSRIFLTGEVGTGKESLAQRIHLLSHRRHKPFISVNCSTYTAGEIESALFGDEAGALSATGNPGFLEMSDGGSIYIRHVDNLPLTAQVGLLRTLEEGVVYRVGSTVPRPINVRLITSTNADIESMIGDAEFREDLYQRLSQVVLIMPPLRTIKNDMALLLKHFVTQAAQERGITPPEVDPAVLECLHAYPWPGNMGELKNLSERLVMFARGQRIVLEDLPLEIRFSPYAFATGEEESTMLAEVEKVMIRRALARTQGDQARTAAMLGITETELDKKSRRYDINVE